MAEWYTLWGQEFLAKWNLLLVTGPSRLQQKVIEKKGDLMIARSLFMMQLSVCVISQSPLDVQFASRSLTLNVECNVQWCQVLNNKEQCVSIPAHLNENGIGSWPDHFSSGREKCGLGTRLPFQIPGFCSLWYDTTSDHNENTQAYSTRVAYRFTSCL